MKIICDHCGSPYDPRILTHTPAKRGGQYCILRAAGVPDRSDAREKARRELKP